jgi:imidazoleglycerol-phosphate dehydratase
MVIGLSRTGNVVRTTRETKVEANVEIDGTGKAMIKTTILFLDHLLVTLAAHSLLNIQLVASGDLAHHVVEDVAITLGEAMSKALDDRDGVTRFGWALVPMDDALALASIDLARRPFTSIDLKVANSNIEGLKSEDIYHFVNSLATSLEATLHLRVQYGRNDHHKVEAAFKALAISLRQACSIDARRRGVPSSKGTI